MRRCTKCRTSFNGKAFVICPQGDGFLQRLPSKYVLAKKVRDAVVAVNSYDSGIHPKMNKDFNFNSFLS